MTEQRPSPDTALDTAVADAAEAFAHWRSTRRRGREHTPPALRTRAVALLDGRRPSHVARALGLNPATLARLAARADGDAVAIGGLSSDAFVPLPDTTAPAVATDTVVVEEPDEEPELIVRWPHGTQLVARGPIPAATLAAILAAAAIAAPSGT